MLQWKSNEVLLVEAVAVVLVLLHLGAGGHAHVFDLVWDVQLGQVDHNLPRNLLFLEIVEAEPESLASDVVVLVPGGLTEDKWPLESIIVLKSESLVEQPPILVVLDDGFLPVVGRRPSQLELEEFDSVFLLGVLSVNGFVLCHESVHEAGPLRLDVLVLHPRQQHLAIPGEEPRVIHIRCGLL